VLVGLVLGAWEPVVWSRVDLTRPASGAAWKGERCVAIVAPMLRPRKARLDA